MKIQPARLSYYPQDSTVGPPAEMTLDARDVGDRLEGPRFRMDDGQPAHPDAQGNYLFQPGTREFQQASSLACATRTMRLFEGALGHEIPWSFRGKLQIHPHYGSGFNAFYLRQDHSINFYDGLDTTTNKTVAGSESLDVVSHETGHAVLDALKPGLVGWFGSSQAAAFHESFGDLASILTSLHDEHVLDQLVVETGGHLGRPNLVAKLAEEMSQGINHVYLGGSRPADWALRDANNDFLYLDPSRLPEKAQPEQLSREPHSFGRIFTGACWEVLTRLTEANMASGQPPRQAIVEARDTMLQLCAHGVELGPNRLKHLGQMARAMLQADQRYLGGQNQKVLTEVMGSRGLLEPAVAESPEPEGPMTCESVVTNAQGETFMRFLRVEEVALDETTTTDLAASLTLGYDRDGKLFHRLYEPVDGEAVALASREVDRLRAEGALRDERQSDLLTPDGRPYAGFQIGRKVFRIPGI